MLYPSVVKFDSYIQSGKYFKLFGESFVTLLIRKRFEIKFGAKLASLSGVLHAWWPFSMQHVSNWHAIGFLSGLDSQKESDLDQNNVGRYSVCQQVIFALLLTWLQSHLPQIITFLYRE